MAYAKELPEDVLMGIASNIAEHLSGLKNISSSSPSVIELGETFEVWMLGKDKIMDQGNDVRSLAHNTHHLYHQLFLDGKPEGFARSKQSGTDPDKWEFASLFLAPLAGEIDKAISWVDDNFKTDSQVVLLSVPTYFLHALWLMNDTDHFLLASFPPEYKFFQYRRFYDPEDFLDTLRRQNPIIGIIK